MKVRPVPLLLSMTAAGLLAGLLAGCSAGSASSGSSESSGSSGSSGSSVVADGAAPARADAGLPAVPAGGAAKPEIASKDSTSSGDLDAQGPGLADPATARVVRTAQLTLRVHTLAAAVTQAEAVATGLGGLVGSENSQFPAGPRADARSILTLRVPQARTDDALTRLAAVGQELDRSTSAQDVTSTIADLDSREQTQARSVARVRDLMDRAGSLKDVVLLESELSRRQADLESLEAQQRVLSDQADLATITVTLVTAPAPTPKAHSHSGFLTGLRAGGRAVAVSTTVLVTGLGAVLPFALIVALLGWPVYLLLRHRRHRSPSTPSTPDPQTLP